MKKAIINQGCIATFLGIIAFLFQINYPKVIEDSVDFLAALNTPFAMICIGGMLYDAKLKEIL